MLDAQPIAVVKDYDDFRTAMRVRMAQLQITFETLDAVSGVQAGHSAKLLGPNPSKHFGPMSFCAVMGALGMKLVAVEDVEALAGSKAGLSNDWLPRASQGPPSSVLKSDRSRSSAMVAGAIRLAAAVRS
jgi:hypothetical protein